MATLNFKSCICEAWRTFRLRVLSFFMLIQIISGCIGLLAVIPSAYAGGVADQATIINVQPYNAPTSLGTKGAFFVMLNKNPTNGASCATYGNVNARFVTDPNSAVGQAIISTLLSAQATGRWVQIGGTGACDIWSDTETILYVYTE